MPILDGPSRPAASGAADSLVIFLHGYGADGNDLIGLAEPLAPHLPDTRFLAPNAPERCPGNPAGFQWFPIPWLDGTPEAVARAAAVVSFDLLDAWLDAVAEEGIGPERTVLVGFSQGTMMALHVALRRAAPLAGIVGFSGRLLDPERLAAEITARAAGAAAPRRPGPGGALRQPRRGRRRRSPAPASRSRPTPSAASATASPRTASAWPSASSASGSGSPGAPPGAAGRVSSCGDLQAADPVALEAEAEVQRHWAAGEGAGDPGGDQHPLAGAIDSFDLRPVAIFAVRLLHPREDRALPFMGAAFVLDHGRGGEGRERGSKVAGVLAGEVSVDRRGQGHHRLHWKRGPRGRLALPAGWG